MCRGMRGMDMLRLLLRRLLRRCCGRQGGCERIAGRSCAWAKLPEACHVQPKQRRIMTELMREGPVRYALMIGDHWMSGDGVR